MPSLLVVSAIVAIIIIIIHGTGQQSTAMVWQFTDRLLFCRQQQQQISKIRLPWKELEKTYVLILDEESIVGSEKHSRWWCGF
jgi:hypothetical protein